MSHYSNQGNYYRPSMYGGFRFFPPVIKWLIILNAAVFVIFRWGGQMYTIDGVQLASWFDYYFGLMPLGHGFWFWQLITYQFIHADMIHILFNMFFGLWMFGMEVEHVLGSRKFLALYLTCGVVAGVSQLMLAPILEPSSVVTDFGLGIPTIGASGAVFGVLVAFAMMFPDRYIFLYFLVPIKAKYFVAILIAIGIWSVGGHGAVANLAHLGGAVMGFFFVSYLAHRFPWTMVDRVKWWVNARTTPRTGEQYEEVLEAKVHDIKESPMSEQDLHQKKIDEILDKISRGGYQSLSEDEKKILFEASKKLN
jgi:membrane associated rhomboid family serine protease